MSGGRGQSDRRQARALYMLKWSKHESNIKSDGLDGVAGDMLGLCLDGVNESHPINMQRMLFHGVKMSRRTVKGVAWVRMSHLR